MTKKIMHKNSMHPRNPLSTDPYTALVFRMKNRWIMALITGILVLGGLSLLSGQGLLQTHWVTFFLLSLSSGCWMLFFSQLVSWFFFLRPRVKNKSKNWTAEYPLANALRKTKHALITFAIFTGIFLFCFFIFLSQQPNRDGTLPFLEWSDFIGVLAFCAFISFLLFMFSSGITNRFLRVRLFKKLNFHNSLSSLDDFQEIHSRTSKMRRQESHSASKTWEAWDHDPMNPASAEYQSTYRHWNQAD